MKEGNLDCRERTCTCTSTSELRWQTARPKKCHERFTSATNPWSSPISFPPRNKEPRRSMWRRREGVEPSGDLTTPRLVLKTSGTTGHLPSPRIKSSTCALLTVAVGALSTIFVSTTFCPCPESSRDIFLFQIEV